MSVKASRPYKMRRAAAWRKQNGRCYYCRRQTRLPEMLEIMGILTKPPPPDMATAEHLTFKVLRAAGEKTKIVMACYSCNNKRGGEHAHMLNIRNAEKLKPEPSP